MLDRVLEFKERLDGFVLLRAGALLEGAITNWRFDNGLLLTRLTFHQLNLTVEHGSQQQVAVSWYSPFPPIIRHICIAQYVTEAATRFTIGGIWTCRICGNLDYACRGPADNAATQAIEGLVGRLNQVQGFGFKDDGPAIF